MHSSYDEDPKWQLKFTYIWVSLVGSAILLSAPSLLRGIKNRRAFAGFWGIWEDWNIYHITPGVQEKPVRQRLKLDTRRRVAGVLKGIGSIFYRTLPGIELNAGQSISLHHPGDTILTAVSLVFVIIGYLVIVLICIVLKAPLIDNPNRAGMSC